MSSILVPTAERVQVTTAELIERLYCCHIAFRHAAQVLPRLHNVLPVPVLQLNVSCPPYLLSHSRVRCVSLGPRPRPSVPSCLERMVVIVILLLLILSGDVETNPGPVGGNLTLDDVGCVLEEIIEMAANWYQLGLQLNLMTVTLDRIRALFSDPIDQLLEMLKTWLKSGVSPSWKTLTDALRSRTVGAIRLAGVLERKYCLLGGTEGHNNATTSDSQPKSMVIPPFPVSQPQSAIVATLPRQLTTTYIGTTYQSYCSNICDVYRGAPFEERNCWPPMGRVKYINLAILKSERLTAGDDYTLMTIQRSADDIVGKKKRINYVELFDGLESGSKILVEGRPGCGKTTLLNRISLDWATKKILKGNELLLLVPLRRFHGKAEVDLADMLQLYDTGRLCDSVATQISLSGGKGVCIVLDGLDEYPRCSQPGNFVLELLEGRKLPNSVVIASSRPAAAHHFRQYATKRVEVLGFLRPEVQQYIQEHYKHDYRKLKSLHTYLEHHPNIRHMCYLPLHLAVVVYLNDAFESGSLPHTETGVYEKFMLYTLLCDMRRDSQSNAENLNDVKQLHPEKLEVFRNICSLAYSATVQSEQIFSRSDVQEVFGSNEFSLESLGLLTEDKLFCEHGLEETYSFAHLTFQEFLAAYHLTELRPAEQIEAAEQHAGEKHMGVIWKFYCGLTKLSGDVAMDVFRVLLRQNDFNPLLLLLSIHESQNPKACCELLSISNGVLCISDEVLTVADMVAVAYCMRNDSSSLTELSFESCYLGSEELHVLTSECSYPLMNVKRLSFKKTLIRKKVVSSFLAFLGRVPNLESLEFPRCSRPPSTAEVAATLSSLKALKSLITNSVVIRSGGGILQLLEAMPALEMIRCSGANLDLEVSKEFAKGTTVRIFKGKKRMTTLLSVKTSDTYDFEFSLQSPPQFPEADAHVIAELFKLCPRVRNINLSLNNIGDEGCAALSRGLQECRELQILNLSSNKIGDEGCAALSRGLQECRELQILDLNDNNLTEASVEHLSELSKTAKSLRASLSLGTEKEGGAVNPIMFEDYKAMSDRETYKTALEENRKLSLCIAQVMTVGAPRSGKSYLKRRLLKQTGKPEMSTGVALKPVVTAVMACGTEWKVLDWEDEGAQFLQKVEQPSEEQSKENQCPSSSKKNISAPADPKVRSDSSVEVQPTKKGPALSVSADAPNLPDQYSSPGVVNEPDINQNEPDLELPSYSDLIDAILDVGSEKWKAAKERLETQCTLYFTDTGGQLEFQEVLPAIISGPSIFFLVFNLEHAGKGLNKEFPAVYKSSNGSVYTPPPGMSTFTTKDLILGILSSIQATKRYHFRKDGEDRVIEPKVLLVGTHSDQVVDTDVRDQIECDVQKLLKDTPYYQHGMLIVPCREPSKERFVYMVDNEFSDDPIFQEIRETVGRLILDKPIGSDYKESIPSHRLAFDLMLRWPGHSEIVKYKDCVDMAKRCGINDDDIEHTLAFLHERFGIIRYFRDAGLSYIVITNPQVIYDAMSDLIAGKFNLSIPDLTPAQVKDFQEKGLFTEDAIKCIAPRTKETALPLPDLIKLLSHLHIIVKLQGDEGNPQYFMPCVLKGAMHDQNTPLKEHDVADLLVVFACDYCPKGLFSTLAIELANKGKQSEKLPMYSWKLNNEKLYKDQVSYFVVEPTGKYIFTVYIQQVAIEHRTVLKLFLGKLCQSADSRRTCLANVCKEIMISVLDGIKLSFATLRYAQECAMFDVGFYSTCGKTCSSHVGILPECSCVPENMICKDCGTTCDLRREHKIWLEIPREIFTEDLRSVAGQAPNADAGSTFMFSTTTVAPVPNVQAPTQQSSSLSCRQQASVYRTTPKSLPCLSPQMDTPYQIQKPLDHLTAQDLHILTSKLKPAAPQWQTIGDALGFKDFEITTIQCKPLLIPEGVTGYFREMLSQWLKWAPPNHSWPTITALETAVRETMHEDLASNFRALFLQNKGSCAPATRSHWKSESKSRSEIQGPCPRESRRNQSTQQRRRSPSVRRSRSSRHHRYHSPPSFRREYHSLSQKKCKHRSRSRSRIRCQQGISRSTTPRQRSFSPSPSRSYRSPVHRRKQSYAYSPILRRRRSHSHSPLPRHQSFGSHSPMHKEKHGSRSPLHRGRERWRSHSRIRCQQGRSRSSTPRQRRKIYSRSPVRRCERSAHSPIPRRRRSHSHSPLPRHQSFGSHSPVHREKHGSRSPLHRGRERWRSRSRIRCQQGSFTPRQRRKYSRSPVRRCERSAHSPIPRRRRSHSHSPLPRHQSFGSHSPVNRAKDESRSPLRCGRGRWKLEESHSPSLSC